MADSRRTYRRRHPPGERGERLLRPDRVAAGALLLGLVGLVAVPEISAQQTPLDTIRPVPLAPVEVRVLRTPVREDMAALAVATLGETDLREGKSGAFLDEAVRGLPGVHVQNRYNFALGEKVIVRGFGGRAQFGIRGVRVLVDGIPATFPDGQGTLDHLDVGSLGRVEAVRGPASALFGNASGGVLAFESRMPPPEPMRFELEHVHGRHGSFDPEGSRRGARSLSRTQGSITGTLNGVGYLLNLSTQDWVGFRPNPISTIDRRVYGEADRVGVNAQLRRNVGSGQLALTVNHLDLSSENPGELTRAQIEEETRTAHGAGPVNNISRRAGKDITQTQAGLTWNGLLGTLNPELSFFGVRRKTFNPIVPTIIDLDRDAYGGRVHAGRAESTAWGPLRWRLGAELEMMADDRLNWPNVTTIASDTLQRGPLTVDQRETVRSAGFFAQANVPLPAGAEGLVGARYDHLKFEADDNIQRAPGDPARTGQRTMSRFSPSIGANVPLSTLFNVFGNVGTVFETPSTTELGNRPDGEGGFNPDLQPQTGVSAELGVRGRVGQSLSYELTAYRVDLRNEIVRYQVEAIPGRDFFRNAGRSRHTGAEATLAAATVDGLLEGRLTYTQTNARFRSFVQDNVDVSGNRIPGIAPRRVEAVGRVNPFGLFGEAVMSYVDEVPVNDRNTPDSSAPSYFLLDLRGGAKSVRVGNFTIAPWAAVTNVLDEYYIASIIPNAAGASPAVARYYDPGPGRSFQLGIRTGLSLGN